MDDPEHLGEALKQLRERYGLQQKEMAKLLCLDPTAYSRIENGTRTIKLEKYSRYLDLFANNLHSETGYFLDERFSLEKLYASAKRELRKMFNFGGEK